MNPSKEDLEWIEQFYSDIEAGHKGIGKVYVRPKDYIERALRVLNNSKERNRIANQFEGKKGVHNEDH